MSCDPLVIEGDIVCRFFGNGERSCQKSCREMTREEKDAQRTNRDPDNTVSAHQIADPNNDPVLWVHCSDEPEHARWTTRVRAGGRMSRSKVNADKKRRTPSFPNFDRRGGGGDIFGGVFYEKVQVSPQEKQAIFFSTETSEKTAKNSFQAAVC